MRPTLGVTTLNKKFPNLKNQLAVHLNQEINRVDWLTGDGSDRSYYRIFLENFSNTYIFMALSDEDTARLKKDDYEWIQMAKLLEQNNVLIPKAIAPCPEVNGIIVEDYGDTMLEGVVNSVSNKAELLQDKIKPALDLMIKMQAIATSSKSLWCQRAFDVERFLWEMNFFKKYFIENLCGIELNKKQLSYFQKESETLCHSLANLKQVFTHRDYHSRNIMVMDGKYTVIDFQDARLGPACYDFVSLIFDSYIDIKPSQRLELLEFSLKYYETKQDDQQLVQELRSFYKMMLVQRQYKALGSFAYLNEVKNKNNYLKYIPGALNLSLIHI